MQAQENTGRMIVKTAVAYKDGMVYVRRIDSDLFIWDAVWGGKLFSSYMVITGEIDQAAENEVVQMCYAGACATIDIQRGEAPTEEEMKHYELFESARDKVEKQVN